MMSGYPRREFIKLGSMAAFLLTSVRKGKHEDQRKELARMITKERASRLEGSFGKEKEQ